MSTETFDEAKLLHEAACALLTRNTKEATALSHLLDCAAEDMLSAEMSGVSWARWEWTHYCFALAHAVLNAEEQRYGETEYECPKCSHVAPWTDGIENEPEFWCRTCGTETPLSLCRAVSK